MKKLLFLSLLFVGVFAFGQNVRYDSPPRAINATVAVCSSPANGLPCSNLATTYDSAGNACPSNAQTTTGIAGSVCSSLTDSQGHIGFWVAAGTYDYTVCAGTSCQGPFTVTLSGAGGGGTVNSGTTSQIATYTGSGTTVGGVTNLSTPGDVYVKGGRPSIDVRAYGVTGNGSTDDITAIQASVTAASNLGTINALPYSAELFFPCGNYLISSPIILPRSTSNTNANGIVKVRGESKACVWLTAAAGFPTGRAMIEWSQSVSGRTLGQEISGITFKDAAVDKQMDIWYQYTGTNQPITTSNVVAERMERLYLHDLEFQGNNQYQQYHIYLQGDCYQCTAERIFTNDARAAGGAASNVYESVLLNTDTCYTSSAPWQEACGWNWGSLNELGQIGNRGGYSPAFQGRLNQSTLSNSFVNGVRGGFSNSYGFGFINSYAPKLDNLGNEGLGDAPQFLFQNTTACDIGLLYPGAADNQGFGIGDAIDYVGTTNCGIRHVNGKQLASQALNSQQWVASTTVGTPGTSYTTATATASGGTCTDLPTYGTITFSGGGIATIPVVNPGNCTGTPTIGIAGDGSGAAATNNMTGAGTLYWLKTDSNSHNNTLKDVHEAGTADISISDLATNFIQACDQVAGCPSYFTIGKIPGEASNTHIEFCTGTITSNTTIVLFPGQVSSTACTSTSSFQGPAFNAGAVKNLRVNVNAASATVGSGVVTVFKNGSSTAITCTLSTGLSCTDLTHSVTIADGDRINIKVQSTAASGDTLAGISGSIQIF